MNTNRIGVGIDFSEDSATATAHAARLADRLGAELVLLHVVPEIAQGLIRPLDQRFQDLASARLAELDQELGKLASDLAARGARTSHALLEGDPGPGLAAAARERDLGLLVLGSTGRTGVRRFLLGSVAERTVRLSESSVLVARGVEPPAGGYERLLVGTDFSEQAERALEAAIGLAAPGARVDVLHCWELPIPIPAADVGGGAAVEPLHQQIQDDVDQAGSELVARFQDRGVKVEFTKLLTSASQGIQEQLEAGDHQIVVLGSHGRRGLQRWLLGSVAEVTVRHAPCSVLVVKPSS